MMRGQVLEIAPSDPVAAIRALRLAREAGRLPISEIELYGSLIHLVAPEVQACRQDIAAELRREGIDPGEMSIIEPSLEDVFIACMKA
jgi:hypothetical protein